MTQIHTVLLSALCLPVLGACASLSEGSSASGPNKTWSQRLKDPITQPTIFESPVITHNVKPMMMHQELPDDSAFAGGNFRVYAVQARYAVNDRLALIATKDGFIDFNPRGATHQEGWADIAAGAKYAFIDEPNWKDGTGLLVTGGATYEIDSGDHEVFQGVGQGIARPFVTAGLDLAEQHINVIAATGVSIPMHRGKDSTSIDYHAHVAYDGLERFTPMLEFHGIHYLTSGRALPFNFEGGDLINLGSTSVAGNTVAYMAVGGRFDINEDLDVGVAYQWPVSGREDLLDSRITLDVTWRF